MPTLRLLATFAVVTVLAAASSGAQDLPPLMPMPAAISMVGGGFRLDSTLRIRIAPTADDRLLAAVTRFAERLAARVGLPLSGDPAPDGQLDITAGGPGEKVQSPDEDESYSLEISPTQVRLAAPTTVGVLRGLETLLQLVAGDRDGFYLPAVHISDSPRFRWRGLLIDAGRHFMPVEVIRRTLDGMAQVKLNVLHWHLSDDQGFRVESHKFPRLQGLGSDGQFYTQDQIREIVSYARARGIRVVPEFDMPGHSTSWFVGYPQYASAPGPYQIERRFGVFDAAFDPTREETYRFLDAFIGEIAGLFPDPYWHIGGDEVSPTYWNQNPRILRFKRQRGFADNEALQAWFNQRLSRILGRYGKRMVGWDEILHDSLPRTTVIQSWRGVEYLGQAASRGFSGILSAPYYLDQMNPADQHYLADPLPPDNGLTPEQAASVLGGEACMWSEQVNAETVDSRIWPRLAVIAERLWSPASVRDVNDMYRRLSVTSIQLERMGLGHEAHTFRMLRLLTGRRGVQPLHDLLAVTMPVTFGQRVRLQGTTQLTPLSRLVDAARPDPWARAQLDRLADQLIANRGKQSSEAQQLRSMFTAWTPLAAQITALADSLPLARDGVPASQALARLATVGLETLDRLGRGSASGDWKASALASLDSLSRPQGLLRLAGVDAVRKLVDAVPSPAKQTGP
jgi:hexosaminidase